MLKLIANITMLLDHIGYLFSLIVHGSVSLDEYPCLCLPMEWQRFCLLNQEKLTNKISFQFIALCSCLSNSIYAVLWDGKTQYRIYMVLGFTGSVPLSANEEYVEQVGKYLWTLYRV